MPASRRAAASPSGRSITSCSSAARSANSWRRERWDSLRLLTPNWQSRLPGYRYDGADPDGYMTMREVIDFISRYAVVVRRAGAHAHHRHRRCGRTDDGYHVATSHGDVAAAAWCWRAAPATSRACRRSARRCRPSIPCFTAFDYRNPDRAAGRRRARRRRLGDRRAARRRDPPLGPTRDAVGRRARPAAADVSRPRRAVVDGRVRRVEPALRRDRRPDARPAAAVAAAGRHARARRRSTSTRSARSASSWSAALPPCATAGRCSQAGCAICSRSRI